MRHLQKIVGLTSLGGALEFYDFTIFILFAPYLAQHFFSSTSHFVNILQTFLVFSLGYFARPLGGIVFGHIGDRYGRKAAFLSSVSIMATATLLIGCLPGVSTLGIWAPIALIILRLLQGFSVGGEIPGAAIFIFEHVPAAKRGWSNSLLFGSITLGNTLGGSVGLLLTAILSSAQMASWGWRIPFVLGFLLGFISYAFRKNTYESPEFLAILRAENAERIPLLTLFKKSKMKLLIGVLLTAVSACLISLFLYLPTYLSNVIKINVSYTYLINLVTFLSFALMTIFFGFISDRVNRLKLVVSGLILLIVFSYPLFHALSIYGEKFIWIFVLAITTFGGMVNGSYVILLCELFPSQRRYSGVGFSYSLGIAFFGGVAPIAFAGLIHALNYQAAPFIVLVVCCLCMLIGIRLLQSQDVSSMSSLIAAKT